MKKKFLAGVALTVICGAANAIEAIVGNITAIEASYLPTTVQFKLNGGSPSCPASTALTWSTTVMDNNKSVYAALLTAFATGKKVVFYVNNGDTTCRGQYIHITE